MTKVDDYIKHFFNQDYSKANVTQELKKMLYTERTNK